MERHIIILFLLITHLSSLSQKAITTDGPCTDAMVQNAKGRWMKSSVFSDKGGSEVIRRIGELHNIMLKIYPEPAGIDAVWHPVLGVSYFGAKRIFFDREYGRKSEDTDLPHFLKYGYACLFFAYRCDYNKKDNIIPGYPGETGTHINITANTSDGAVGESGDETWTINGLPVRSKPPVLKTIRGYEIQYPEPGSNSRYVLVHRKGILPYIPVTRKQYLDQCIIFTTNLHDGMIKAQEQMPVRTLAEQEKEKKGKLDKFQKDFGNDPKRLKSTVDYYLSGYQTDQQQRDERVNKAKQRKIEELKKFSDELEKTTREGLLDSPAVVLVRYYPDPVFETDPLKGNMLVTENPAYIHKDLPKHMPQVFVVWWTSQNWAPQKEIGKIIEEKFPFEKLEAMIDK